MGEEGVSNLHSEVLAYAPGEGDCCPDFKEIYEHCAISAINNINQKNNQKFHNENSYKFI